MRNVYAALTALLLSTISLSAQTVTSKDFNDVKRSKQYFYYDITMAKEDDAKNAANVNLAKLINDYCVENSITNVKVSDTDLKNVRYLKMDKNGMIRILAYVEKATLIGNELSADKSVAKSLEKEKKENVSQDQTTVVKVEVRKTEQPTQTVKSKKIDEGMVKSHVKIQEVNISSGNIPSPETAGLAGNEPASSLVKWQQDVVQDLCHIQSAERLMMRLSELQNQYKVKRFGLNSDCRNPNECFWVVYDSSKNVIAILGPGESVRYNFYKGVNDNLETYWSKGMNGIWFQLSK